MKKNKGFSLVELIIVIAIMAILIGVMAPQLVKYVERTKVSSDVQLCDSIHTALLVAINDPDVVMATDKSGDWRGELMDPGTTFRLDSYGGDWVTCQFAEAVKDQLGFNPFANATNNYKYLKSKPAHTQGIICVAVNSTGTAFAVYIANSDMTGKGVGHNVTSVRYETLESSDMIFAK